MLTSREVSLVGRRREDSGGTRLLPLPVAIPLLSGSLLLAVLFELLAFGAQVGLAAGALPLLPVAARWRHGGESSNLLSRVPVRADKPW
jgi:hypothetical protein